MLRISHNLNIRMIDVIKLDAGNNAFVIMSRFTNP